MAEYVFSLFNCALAGAWFYEGINTREFGGAMFKLGTAVACLASSALWFARAQA